MTTNAELAILSLVAERPRHGYEIEQVIEERGMREWTEVGFSSIYYLLRKLEQERLIEGQLEEAERGPARKVFRITQTGIEARKAALLEALSVPWRDYPPLMLGIANLPALAPAEVITALQKYRDELAARRDEVKAKRKSQSPLPYFVEAMFDYSLTKIKTELEWVGKFIKQVEDQTGR
jgi:DNA-binding PadR family transcriptional regulator